MIPQVNSAEEAARAVDAAHYPPEGNRGLSPMWTRIAGEDWDHVLATAGDETLLVCQLESLQALGEPGRDRRRARASTSSWWAPWTCRRRWG